MDYRIKLLVIAVISFWPAADLLHAQIPLSVEFGDPAAGCIGRGKICHVDEADQERKGEAFETAWLVSIAGIGWQLHFQVPDEMDVFPDVRFPNGYCELPKEIVLSVDLSGAEKEFPPEQNELRIPAGRYRLYAGEQSWYIEF